MITDRLTLDLDFLAQTLAAFTCYPHPKSGNQSSFEMGKVLERPPARNLPAGRKGLGQAVRLLERQLPGQGSLQSAVLGLRGAVGPLTRGK